MANPRRQCDPRKRPIDLAALLMLLGVLGLCLAPAGGLHFHERADSRSDVLEWLASQGGVASGQADVHDGALCTACSVRSKSKACVVDLALLGHVWSGTRDDGPVPGAESRAIVRWQSAPAPPRAPPIA